MRFRLDPYDLANSLPDFGSVFQRYLRSTDRLQHLCLGRLSLMHNPISVLSDRLVQLHSVGQGLFETVNTCLRVADGKLLAVKTLLPSGGATERDQQQSTVEFPDANDEVSLLSRMQHVCYTILHIGNDIANLKHSQMWSSSWATHPPSRLPSYLWNM